MADIRVRKIEQGQTKIRNVPIAVTPEGFWCCPSPVVFQKTLKNQSLQNKQKTPPPSIKSQEQKPQKPLPEKKTTSTPSRSRATSEEQKCVDPDNSTKANAVTQQRKISVGFGQPDTSDLKVILFGKEGISVRMSVHKCNLLEHSDYFKEKLWVDSSMTCLEIGDCEDVEIYVETVGLMYCKEVKHRLIKQSVPRVLRILKVAKVLCFHECMQACIEYLEAVPWVGEEEENVVSSIRHLQINNSGVNSLLRRVSNEVPNPPNDTLARILELVLKSNEDKGRRETKSLVLKLLKENSLWISGSNDICTQTLYNSCHTCLASLLELFKQASEPDFKEKSLEVKDPVTRQIALEADNLLWLVEILIDRHVADEFTELWASQVELASLHSKLSIVSRHLISCITSRLFVGIGKGEMLPSKETKQMLLQVWLQPLIGDYSWLQHACRSFDRKVVEEGIGRTILTLPLEDQQSILLSWLGSFLKIGDNCPNLQRAFEVWWRRTFIRPYVEQQASVLPSDNGH